MRKPDIIDYPTWMREYIKEQMPRSISSNEQNCQNELRQVHDARRVNPIAKVLFYLTVEVIRLRFELWTLHQRVERVETLRFIPENFTARQIRAVKACAAQKMSEATPEDEAEWDTALDDQWGNS